jgi:predicted HD phosphohydrolase
VTRDEGIIGEVLGMLDRAGSESYGGEAVSQLEHALQAAALAEQDGWDEEFVVACLLHDLGHLTPQAQEVLDLAAAAADDDLRERQRHEALDHGAAGARFLADAASARLRYLVAGHAAAKRYLCTVEPA